MSLNPRLTRTQALSLAVLARVKVIRCDRLMSVTGLSIDEAKDLAVKRLIRVAHNKFGIRLETLNPGAFSYQRLTLTRAGRIAVGEDS